MMYLLQIHLHKEIRRENHLTNLRFVSFAHTQHSVSYVTLLGDPQFLWKLFVTPQWPRFLACVLYEASLTDARDSL